MQDDRNERYERATAAAEKTLQIEALRKEIKVLKQRIKDDQAIPEDFKSALRFHRRMAREYGVWQVKRDAYERGPRPDGSKRCDYADLPHSGGGTNHGPATQSSGGYNICQKCYDAILDAERKEEARYSDGSTPPKP